MEIDKAHYHEDNFKMVVGEDGLTALCAFVDGIGDVPILSGTLLEVKFHAQNQPKTERKETPLDRLDRGLARIVKINGKYAIVDND